jgi:hypothetical protein
MQVKALVAAGVAEASPPPRTARRTATPCGGTAVARFGPAGPGSGCHHQCVGFFTLAAPSTDQPQAEVEAALRRAWSACADVACPKCGVAAWQYCRNPMAGRRGWMVTRFHRPRQDAASAPAILSPVGIYGLSWAKGKGRFEWRGQRAPAA